MEEINMSKEVRNFLKSIDFYSSAKKYVECYNHAGELLNDLPKNSIEYIFLEGIQKSCEFLIGKNPIIDIKSNLRVLKKAGYLLEWALLKQLEFEAYYDKNAKEIIPYIIADIMEVETVLKNSNAKSKTKRVKEVRDWIFKEYQKRFCSARILCDYLKIFQRLGSIIHSYLGEDNFAEKILDLLIETTNSERGGLFLICNSKLKLAAGRNVKQVTINDAKRISRSVIKETVKKSDMICCSNAMLDPRFKKSKSVILNQIRSIICAPLKGRDRIIGAIYLDDRRIDKLFSEDDRNFLTTVTDFVGSVIERSKIFQKIKEETIFLRAGIVPGNYEDYLIGESPAIVAIRDMIEKFAKTDSSVLITGETGSGKSLVAQLLHQRSTRRNYRFVTVNSASVPETLFESELFGYKKGAFTGAFTNKKGLFEEADKGTLFLDEISNTPVVTQGKLLEVIETKRIRRLGETIERIVDVKLISATNRNLKEMIEARGFREDLYYRISVLTITIPPLRERVSDISLLADHFLKKYASELHRKIMGFDKKAVKKMLLYPWPGNIRELQNMIERAIILTQNRYISADDLQLSTETKCKQMIYEEKIITSVLKSAKGNISMAAKMLGTTRRTLYNYIKRYKIHVCRN
jgi:Nif-specific regulatory protein